MPAPDLPDIEDALTIAIASDPRLPEPEVRRLTGPGLLWPLPGAVLDVFTADFDSGRIAGLWQTHARKVLDAIGWTDQKITSRVFSGGVTLAVSAPRDLLYSAVFAGQTAWTFCAADLLNLPAPNLAPLIADLLAVIGREANPALTRLLDRAKGRGLDALCDDDTLSIGHGAGSQSWSMAKLPDPGAVNWPALHNIPLALITGTNGKTTTTRVCAAIGRAAGLVSGLTSTDFVRVGNDILEEGDFSGPGGARMLLRDPRLQIGFLEVARGGILRRGLPVEQAGAAAVLNVAADHLGEYGVNTVSDLAAAKFAVRHALAPGGILVLNADDANVRAQAALTRAAIWRDSLTPDAPEITDARARRRPCAWFDGTHLIFFDGTQEVAVIRADLVPITLNGRAPYNIANALAAICLTRALGIADAAIAQGLAGFQSDATDNPGRCNEFSVRGAQVFVDFAHNPHSIAAVTGALSNLPAKRRYVMISHAGDRSDDDIRGLVAGALALAPDLVVAAELDAYRRGRRLGEVPDLIRQTCLDLGMTQAQVRFAASPLAGARDILARLHPGDLALLLVHAERDEIFELLTAPGQA